VADDALPELHGERVTLRPLAAKHAEGLRAIRRTQPVADWWGPLEDDFPGDDEPTARRHAILVGDELAGMIQFTEENEPDWRNAEIDIFLDAAWHGQSYGTEAITTLIGYLTGDRGHHRVVIGTAIGNLAARRSYEKAGFRHVGITHRSGRDYRTGEFGDEWFLELVVPVEEKGA
jgi:aminoglycoside 6'-N-acetyltransferase